MDGIQAMKMSVFSLEMNKYYFEMERKLSREGRGSPVDADIFANGILLPNRETKGGPTPLSKTATRDRYFPYLVHPAQPVVDQ